MKAGNGWMWNESGIDCHPFYYIFYRWISMNKDENNLNLLSITNPRKSGQNVLYEENYIYCFEYNLQW